MAKNKKPVSTVERWMRKPGFKKGVQHAHKELLLSEWILAIMAGDSDSANKLADRLGIAPSMMESVRAGAATDLSLSDFVKIAHTHGYELYLEKPGERITLQAAS